MRPVASACLTIAVALGDGDSYPLIGHQALTLEIRPVRESGEKAGEIGSGGAGPGLDREQAPSRLFERLSERRLREPAQVPRVGEAGGNRVKTAFDEVPHEREMARVGDTRDERRAGRGERLRQRQGPDGVVEVLEDVCEEKSVERPALAGEIFEDSRRVSDEDPVELPAGALGLCAVALDAADLEPLRAAREACRGASRARTHVEE